MADSEKKSDSVETVFRSHLARIAERLIFSGDNASNASAHAYIKHTQAQ